MSTVFNGDAPVGCRVVPAVILLVLLGAEVHDGANLAPRANETEDRRRSSLPLVVAVPSKVSRVNRPSSSSNDIFDRPVFVGPLYKASLMMEQPLSMSSFATEDLTRRPSVEATARTTTTTTEEPPPSTYSVEPSTTTTTTTTTTTMGAPPVTSMEDGKWRTSSSAAVPDVIITVPTTTSTTTSEDPTTTITTEATSSARTAAAEEEAEEATLSTAASHGTNRTSTQATSSDAVVEKDYGLSLGVNGDGDIVDGHSGDDARPEELDHKSELAAAGGGIAQTSAEGVELADEPLEGDAEERLAVDDVAGAAEEEAEGEEEEDPMDLAAQASEVDYAVVVPAEGLRYDLSALRDLAGGDFPEHRSVERDSGGDSSGSPLRAVVQRGSSAIPADVDVKTSMTYSMAVLHPLGEYEADAASLDRRSKSETPKKSSPKPKPPRPLLPAIALWTRKTSAETADEVVVVMDAARNGTSADDYSDLPSNSTLVVLNASPDEVPPVSGTEDFLRSRPSQNVFYSRRYRPVNMPSQMKDADSDNKDLVPAESVQEPFFMVEPDPGETEMSAPQPSSVDAEQPPPPPKSLNGAARILDSEMEPSQDDPAMLSDDGEYEYIYEYIDLNSTDLPENLPEGAVIVTDEQLGSVFPLGELRPQHQAVIPPPLPTIRNASLDQAAEEEADVARPPTYRTFDPTVVINPAELSLTQGNGSQVIVDSSVRQHQQQIVGEATGPTPLRGAEEEEAEGPLPFLPGMPDSPVYFVGIQREKIGSALDQGQRSSSSVGGHQGSVGANAVLDGGLHGSKGNEAQLMSLYALSKALPMDDTASFIEIPGTNGSSSVFIPSNLPDPFSGVLLEDTRPNATVTVFEAASTEASVATSSTEAEVSTTTTETTTTTTEVPSPDTTKAADKAAAAGRGQRPRGSRRSSTMATSADTETTEAAVAAISSEPTRRTRPSRPGGRRRTSTTTTATPADEATLKATEATADEDRKGPTTEKSRFGGRSRIRTTTTPRGRLSATSSEPDANSSRDKESNTISANRVTKRPFAGQRTTTARPSTSSDGDKFTADKEDKPARGAATRPSRGRRPASLTKSTSEEKSTTAASAIAKDADDAEGSAGRKSQLFRLRNRGRFGPKSKTTAEAESATEQAASETTPSEANAEEPVETGAPKQQGSGEAQEPEVTDDPAGDVAATGTDAAPSEEGDATTEDSGPPRKFPPRFRPGSRATIPHRTTEASA